MGTQSDRKSEEKNATEKPAGEAKQPVAEKVKAEKPVAQEEDCKDAPPSSRPPETVLKVYMHCDGCARKIRRCLMRFEGVKEVVTDCNAHQVVVRGQNADPVMVRERLQRKIRRQVELLSPILKPPGNEKGDEAEVKPKSETEEKKKESPPVITVVLKVHMHCEACALEIKKRIQRMKGVELAEPDFKSSQVSVKGVLDPAKLAEYVYKRTGKHAAIVKRDDGKGGDQMSDGKEEGGEGRKQERNAAGDSGAADEAVMAAEAAGNGERESVGLPTADVKRSEYYFSGQPAVYAREMPPVYPPQIFSDENPNACSIM